MEEGGDGEEKEASRNDVEMEANECEEQEGSEVGRRLWDVHGADSASPSPEVSPSYRYGFGSDELLPQSVGDSGWGGGLVSHGESNGGPISEMSSADPGIEVSASASVQSRREESENNTQLINRSDVSGSSGVVRRVTSKSKKSKAKPSTRSYPVASSRAYNTTGKGRGERYENRERRKEGGVQENVINSVNSGGSVQLESIVPAAQVPGAIDSSQGSELVMTM